MSHTTMKALPLPDPCLATATNIDSMTWESQSTSQAYSYMYVIHSFHLSTVYLNVCSGWEIGIKGIRLRNQRGEKDLLKEVLYLNDSDPLLQQRNIGPWAQARKGVPKPGRIMSRLSCTHRLWTLESEQSKGSLGGISVPEPGLHKKYEGVRKGTWMGRDSWERPLLHSICPNHFQVDYRPKCEWCC